MNMWFLVVLFINNPDAKIAIFKNEEECKKNITTVIKELKTETNIKSIECREGIITRDYIEKNS